MSGPGSAVLPARGFPVEEFEARCERAQARMAEAGISALLLTREPELRYYTGFLTRFWESPTRPWFLVLPVDGAPIAVIPAIGAHLMGQTWIDDIRTWPAPDYEDDGIGLLAETLKGVVPVGERIGLAHHLESHLQMPLGSFFRLRDALETRQVTEDAGITAGLRQIKSPAEIARIEAAVAVATRAFDRVPEIAAPGVPLSEVFRRFQILCIDEGADWVPYLAGAAGQGGYFDVISPATDAPLAPGDVLMLDTGAIRDGYFCDFDRNYAVGAPSPAIRDGHAVLVDAVRAGFEAARPGARFCDLYEAMESVLRLGPDAGRLGHGLGMELTEGPSIVPADGTLLEPGMVLTLEPSVMVGDGRLLVHEEDIVIEERGARFLTRPEGREPRVI
jgi:Xaa-Pro aminopeptidase